MKRKKRFKRFKIKFKNVTLAQVFEECFALANIKYLLPTS